MNPKKITSEILKENYFYMKHPSGLDIYVYPKRGYNSKYAIIGSNFGSINNKFKLNGESSYTNVPDGTAHYLEHKLFESKKGDAFELFAKTGASANAYTSFEKTAYLFSCTDNFEKSLEILLDFVQSPYFTEQGVLKERGIISQEIKMYNDSPDWKVLINLLGALYKNHPINIDIAGSVESISKITPETLYQCYNAFYNLNNMCLCVVGNVDYINVFEIVDKNLKFSPAVKVERFFPDEPYEIAKKEISKKLDVETSVFNLGFKENISKGQRVTIKDLVYNDLIINAISSKSSDMYDELIKTQSINEISFSNEYLEGPGYASVIFSGESQSPEKACEIIKKHIKKAHQNGIDKKTFERAKKYAYGQSLAVFNSVSSIANLQLDFALAGKEIFEYLETLKNADYNELNAQLDKKLDVNNSALSIVKPKNEQ